MESAARSAERKKVPRSSDHRKHGVLRIGGALPACRRRHAGSLCPGSGFFGLFRQPHSTATLRGNPMKWKVYIVQTESGKLYTGITTDLARRLREHLGGRRGAKFFLSSKPARLVFSEAHPSRSSASTRESQIKRM